MVNLPDPFFLIVADSDGARFTVEGPMQNDERWNAAVVAAQKSGRQVRCHSTHGASAASVAESYARAYPRFSLAPAGSIVHPSKETIG
jgi:hypothetical protein